MAARAVTSCGSDLHLTSLVRGRVLNIPELPSITVTVSLKLGVCLLGKCKLLATMKKKCVLNGHFLDVGIELAPESFVTWTQRH